MYCKSKNLSTKTIKSYEQSLKLFERYCTDKGYSSKPGHLLLFFPQQQNIVINRPQLMRNRLINMHMSKIPLLKIWRIRKQPIPIIKHF
ncbi:MAG TPA: hypothetical protein DIW07_09005 [Lachnospiraceae bacterium]|nr:hypothetical protein [Lachnospiraceae bacterium]